MFSMLPVSEGELVGYPDYSGISHEMAELNETFPDICSLHSIGKTHEGRDIWALKISDNPDIEEDDEPDVLIMGGHHAKELISAVVPLRFAESVLENYSSSVEIKNIVDSTEIWVVPLVNPDGYQYAWEGHTEWRKNRRPVDTDGDGMADGIGVDLNRNYGYRWSEQGASSDPDSEIYCGPAPFSENETKAIRSLVLSHDFVFSVSFHSYGQIIYHPWGNSIDPEPMDIELMEALSAGMSGYNLYQVMEGKEAYSTTGDSDDWLYANTSTLPFTIELSTMFIPPPQDITPIFLRNRDALLYLISMSDNPYMSLSPEKTNLRISSFTFMGNNAVIGVENQGNYSVSAELSVSSSMGSNSTSILLGPHESSEVVMATLWSDTPASAEIRSIHGAKEWNTTDNSAVYYPPIDEREDVDWIHTIGRIAGVLLVFGIGMHLLYLFKKNKFH